MHSILREMQRDFKDHARGQCSKNELHIRKITDGVEQEGRRERYNETSRTMQEVSVPEMDLHIRKITGGDEQEGKERGTTRLQG